MNSLKLFCILTAVFIMLAFVWIGAQNTPQWAALLGLLALCSGGRALILFEDEQPAF